MAKGLWIKTDETVWSQIAEDNSSNFAIQTEEDFWPNAEIVYVKTGPTTWTQAWNRIPPTPVITDSVPDERQITITWTSGDNDDYIPFDFVKWQFTINNGTTWFDDNTNIFLREKTLTGLNEGTSYYVGVRMVDSAGKTAQAIELVTTENIPPDAPYNITVDSRTQTSLTISWDFDTIPPDFLRWRFSSNGGSSWVNSTNSSLRSYTFSSLTAGDLYNLVVRVEDTGGNTADDSVEEYTLPPTPGAPTLTNGRDGWDIETFAVYKSDIDAGLASLDDVTRSISCSVSYNGKDNNQYCYYELLNSANESLETSETFDLVTTATTLEYEFVGLIRNTEYKVRLVSVDNYDEEIAGSISTITTLQYSSENITEEQQKYVDTWFDFGYDDSSGITSSGEFSSTYIDDNVGDDTPTTAWVSGGYTSAGSSASSTLPYIQGRGYGGQTGLDATKYYTEIGRIRIRSGYAQSYSLHIGLNNVNGTTVWQGTSTIQGLKYWGTSTYNGSGNYDEYNFPNLTQTAGRKYFVRLHIWDMDRWPNSTTSSFRAIIRDIQILERNWYPEDVVVDVGYY
jgi:hypothetical protein